MFTLLCMPQFTMSLFHYEMNALAESSPGFVWRLRGEGVTHEGCTLVSAKSRCGSNAGYVTQRDFLDLITRTADLDLNCFHEGGRQHREGSSVLILQKLIEWIVQRTFCFQDRKLTLWL